MVRVLVICSSPGSFPRDGVSLESASCPIVKRAAALTGQLFNCPLPSRGPPPPRFPINERAPNRAARLFRRFLVSSRLPFSSFLSGLSVEREIPRYTHSPGYEKRHCRSRRKCSTRFRRRLKFRHAEGSAVKLGLFAPMPGYIFDILNVFNALQDLIVNFGFWFRWNYDSSWFSLVYDDTGLFFYEDMKSKR